MIKIFRRLLLKKSGEKILLKIIKEKQQGFLIIRGDLNIFSDFTLDSTSRVHRPPATIGKFLNAKNLLDVWRCLHLNEKD